MAPTVHPARLHFVGRTLELLARSEISRWEDGDRFVLYKKANAFIIIVIGYQMPYAGIGDSMDHSEPKGSKQMDGLDNIEDSEIIRVQDPEASANLRTFVMDEEDNTTRRVSRLPTCMAVLLHARHAAVL